MAESKEKREFLEQFTLEMSDPYRQEQIQTVIKNTPESYRHKVENRELAEDGIMKTTEGYSKDGKAAPENLVEDALHRADERMLRESPALITHKLRFKSGLLVPDYAAYKE